MLGNQFVPNTLTVFFFVWPSASAKRARIARHLVQSILNGIWVFRNKATFYNVSYDHRAFVKYIVGDLRQKVRTDYLTFNSRFPDFWVLDGFCAVESGLPELNGYSSFIFTRCSCYAWKCLFVRAFIYLFFLYCIVII